jgi:hypothetical protein
VSHGAELGRPAKVATRRGGAACQTVSVPAVFRAAGDKEKAPRMDLAGLLVFAAAYLMATASPGPGVAAVVARGAGGSASFIAGFVLGDLV